MFKFRIESISYFYILRIMFHGPTSENDSYSVQFSSVAQLSPTLCNPICSMPGFPIHHQFPELAQMTDFLWTVQFNLVTQSCLTLCNPMDCSMIRSPCPSATSRVYSNSCSLSL